MSEKQEPIAWMYQRENGAAYLSFDDEEVNRQPFTKTPLYTHPELSEDYVFVCKHCGDKLGIEWHEDAIAELKINPKESQEQEPVAWTIQEQLNWLSNELNNCSLMWNSNSHKKTGLKPSVKFIPLYTHPAQPLSDDEIYKASDEAHHQVIDLDIKENKVHGMDTYKILFARAIEKAIMEKNK